MPDINLPEVKFPDFKLPDGFRDMSREDIMNAARDVRMPKRSDLPDIDLSKIDLSKMDLSKVELPKQIADRMPNRKRSNPILPIAGFLAVGAAIAAAWWLITSPLTGPRIRTAVSDLKSRVTGEANGLVRYDNDGDLGSLVTDSPEPSMSSIASEPYEMPEGVRSN
jgi:hypothetical protein